MTAFAALSTNPENTSSGVAKPSALRGRLLSRIAIASSSARENTDRSVLLGRYWRNGLLVFPLEPRHRRMRIGEVNAQTRERGRFPVSRHLPASIIGQGEAEQCFYRKQTGGEAVARSPAHPSRPCTAD